MKYLKSYRELLSKNDLSQFDKQTLSFCLNKISESDYLQYLNSEITNENFFGDLLKSVKEKIFNIFSTFVFKAYEIGLSIFEKVTTFITWLINKIKKWREDNPTMWRITVITIVIIVLIIVSASTAKAATTGTPVPTEKIDLAIGWLDSLRSGGKEDPFIISKAMARLIDLRDGQLDIQGLGKEAINMADAALNAADKIINDSRAQTDPSFVKFCTSLIQKGQNYIDVIFTSSGISGTEDLKLILK